MLEFPTPSVICSLFYFPVLGLAFARPLLPAALIRSSLAPTTGRIGLFLDGASGWLLALF